MDEEYIKFNADWNNNCYSAKAICDGKSKVYLVLEKHWWKLGVTFSLQLDGNLKIY